MTGINDLFGLPVAHSVADEFKKFGFGLRVFIPNPLPSEQHKVIFFRFRQQLPVGGNPFDRDTQLLRQEPGNISHVAL